MTLIKTLLSLALALLLASSPSAIAQDEMPPQAAPHVAKIREFDGKITRNDKLAKLHEKCRTCETCSCKKIKKKGAYEQSFVSSKKKPVMQHRHTASSTYRGAELRVTHVADNLGESYSMAITAHNDGRGGAGSAKTYMGHEVNMSISKLRDANEEYMEQIRRHEAKLNKMGFSPATHPALYSRATRKGAAPAPAR